MELIKKNIISVIYAFVAILAIVASFFPLGGYIGELQKSLDDSKSKYSTLESLTTKQRNLPILSLDETTPLPLGMFPSQDVIDKAGKVVKEVAIQSIKMRDAAVGMNKRTRLVAGSLPNPGARDEIAFRDTYIPLMTFGPNGEISKLLAEYRAGIMPPKALIDKEVLERQNEIHQTKTQRDFRGQIINQQEINELIAQVAAEVPAERRRKLASESSFYVDATTLDVAPGIAGTARPRPESIWWAQVVLWIQRDVLAAITEANKGSNELSVAPVKRLRKLTVPFINTFVAAGGQTAAASDPAAAADVAVPKVVQASPTGRVSNGMYDVVHFRIEADVEVERIPHLLRTLSHNRLMTAFHVEAKAIDATEAQLSGYFYGDKPVAAVTLQCEALLLRSWTVPLMPKLVRQQLQIPDPPPPAVTAPTAAAQ